MIATLMMCGLTMKAIYAKNLAGTTQPTLAAPQIAALKPFEIDEQVAQLPAPKTVLPAVKTISEPSTPAPTPAPASDEVITVRKANGISGPTLEPVVKTTQLPEIKTADTTPAPAPAPRKQVIQILPAVTDTKVPQQLPTVADLTPGPNPAPTSDEVITLKKAGAAPLADVSPSPRPNSDSNNYLPLDPKDLGLIPQGSTPPPATESKSTPVLPPVTPISGPIGRKKSK